MAFPPKSKAKGGDGKQSPPAFTKGKQFGQADQMAKAEALRRRKGSKRLPA